MEVVFRTDASLKIGTGHVMRCLTLANALRKGGATCRFICREHSGNLLGLIRKQGFDAIALPSVDTYAEPHSALDDDQLAHAAWLGVNWSVDAEETKTSIAETVVDWLIIDHYALDIRWESVLRSVTRRMMVIDDLADRFHDADVLLDQNIYSNMHSRYATLVPADCKQLVGPEYALLRQEFSEARQRCRQRNGSVRRVFVFFGGSDVTDETSKTLAAFDAIRLDGLKIDVVVGAGNTHFFAIANLCANMPGVELHREVTQMADLMSKADLAIGAAGSTTWERCAVGLPALVISVADNQIAIANGVDAAGAHRHLGLFKNVSLKYLSTAIDEICRAPEFLRKMSQSAFALVDARGCDRVVFGLKEFG